VSQRSITHQCETATLIQRKHDCTVTSPKLLPSYPLTSVSWNLHPFPTPWPPAGSLSLSPVIAPSLLHTNITPIITSLWFSHLIHDPAGGLLTHKHVHWHMEACAHAHEHMNIRTRFRISGLFPISFPHHSVCDRRRWRRALTSSVMVLIWHLHLLIPFRLHYIENEVGSLFIVLPGD